MSPIRIGFIGLSSGQSWAVWSHLHYLKSTSKYTVTALCNSSVASAEAAIKAHKLDSSTKAYGSPQDLANDPNVDLVVCSVKVPDHYATIVPALRAGKDVFCEWPLAKNLAEAEELTNLAKSKGVKTLVGLQAQVSPAMNTIKQIIDSGRIGKVLSTTFHGTPKFFGGKEWEGLAFMQDKGNGAELLTIYAMHCKCSFHPR
jgi:predicted dehydrogenase